MADLSHVFFVMFLVTFSLEDSIATTDWYLVNIRQYNYYRVNYDLENWGRLAQQLQDDKDVSIADLQGKVRLVLHGG